MFGIRKKLSLRQRFWFGFLCAPFITWIAAAIVVSLSVILDRSSPISGGRFSSVGSVALIVVGFVSLGAIPIFAGFCTAFFWRHFVPASESEDTATFWSVALTWAPALVGVAALTRSAEIVFIICIFLCLPGLAFMLLYKGGLRTSYKFWNSNRPRQWLGDFSDMGPSNDSQVDT